MPINKDSRPGPEELELKLPSWPQVPFETFGEIDVRPLSSFKKFAAGVLHRNAVAIPHVTHHDDIDVTDIETARKRLRARLPERKLSLLPFVVRALQKTLELHPTFNSSLHPDGKSLVFKKYFNIGIAVDTPKGLLVPVIPGCAEKTVLEIADYISAIATKAREKGLSIPEMSGGSMTISSLGHIGGTAFTPIINAPEVAILGMTRLAWKPQYDGSAGINWRLILPLSLSYDHRVIDGADAARFLVDLQKMLEALVDEADSF